MEVESHCELVIPSKDSKPLTLEPKSTTSLPASFVVCGEEIVALEQGWMKGHGTEIVDGKLYATGM